MYLPGGGGLSNMKVTGKKWVMGVDCSEKTGSWGVRFAKKGVIIQVDDIGRHMGVPPGY